MKVYIKTITVLILLTYTDNAMCSIDFGDAPSNYTHVHHKIDKNLYLGNSIPDFENDQQSSTDATGDGDDDNDGVVGVVPTLTVGDSSYTVPVKVFNNTGKTAYITAWIDFNRNGTFEFSEALNTSNLSIPSSSNSQTVNIVWDDSTDGNTQAIANATEGKAIMRIRLTTERILRCVEDNEKNEPENLISPDGEVEDYEISIESSKKPFTCNNNGIIFAGDSGFNTPSTIVNELNLETKVFNANLKTTDRHVNAIGYNVKDNLIYGIGFRSKKDDVAQLVQVDADYKMTYYDIPGLKQGGAWYALGDVDFHNKFYVGTISDEDGTYSYLKELTVIDLETKKIEKTIPLVFPSNMTQKRIISADFAFNPIDEKLYTVNYETNQLTQIDPITGQVKELGDVGTIDGESYSVISFFDLSGKFIFINSTANTLYMIDVSDPSNINTTASVYKSNLNLPTSGDGAKCAYSKLPEPPKVVGKFNIERTNSAKSKINTKERNAWYTQIVGRDFDYSVLFYDEKMTKEKEMPEMNVKIELINEDSNKTLYTKYAHVLKDSKTKRIDVLMPKEDLASLPATKKAIFRITYAINKDGSIKEDSCQNDYKACLEAQKTTRTDYAKDNFAIRPESFYISLADKNHERTNSRTPDANLTMSAGYDYNLTVNATKYHSINASKGYTKRVESEFPFNKKGMTAWNDVSSIKESIQFANGTFTDSTFHHDNVGNYTLSIADDTTWTAVDQKSGDCNLGESNTSKTANEKSGCNIAQAKYPIALTFYPDHFDVNVTLSNLPSSGHPDFIYMNSLTADNGVAISFNGTITAKSENNVTTSNFIVGCMATDLVLNLNASQVSTEGTDKKIKATDGTNVNFSRSVSFNNDNNFTTEDKLTKISNILNIPNATFLQDNKGRMSLDMRYNLNKHLTAPVNPIQVTFNTLSASSVPASSVSHLMENPMYVPKGSTTFNDNVKQFYYAKVVSDLERYPQVNTNLNPTVITPLNVDIYCKTDDSTYCTDRNINTNGNSEGTTRDQNGWFISRHHDGDLDGKVTNLTTPNHNLTLNPSNNILMPNGHNPLPSATFKNCSTPNGTITITTSPALTVDPASTYEVSCTNNQPSTWTGTGETGHTINTSPNIDNSNRMSW